MTIRLLSGARILVHTISKSSERTSHVSVPMTLEEARQVLWVRPERRPLGELLDEGIVTRPRLEWAVLYAYPAELRQAAQVLLDAFNKDQKPNANAPSKPADASNMALDRARSTVWPFNEFKGRSMGELLDLGLLNLKSLGYAVENAHDSRVQEAAKTLILHRFEQTTTETPNRGVVKIVSGGRSFALRKQFELFMVMGLTFGAILGALLMFALWSFVSGAQFSAANPAREYSPLMVILVLFLFAGLGVFVFWLITRVLDRIFNAFTVRINRYRRGQEGEDRVVEAILPVLDGQWTLFRNVSLPGRKADLDAVLVGPAGIWLLEIKTYRGTHRVSGNRWESSRSGHWHEVSRNPSKQATRSAVELSGFLKEHGVTLWIEPVVMWANPEAPLIQESPQPSVWVMDTLRDELGNLASERTAKAAEVQRAALTLTNLCEAAMRERNAEMEAY